METQIKKQQHTDRILNEINNTLYSYQVKESNDKNIQLNTNDDDLIPDDILYDNEEKNIKKHNLTSTEIAEINRKYKN